MTTPEGRLEANLFRALMTHSVQCIIVIDEKGIMREISDSALERFGHERKQCIGHNVSMLMPEPFSSEHNYLIKKYMETGESRVIGQRRVVPALTAHGSQFPVEVSLSEMYIDQRRMFVGILTDVTEQVREESILAENVDKARRITDSVTDGIITANFKGHIVGMNWAAEKMLGVTFSEVDGKNIKIFMPPKAANKHDEYLAAYRRTGKKKMMNATTAIQAKKYNGDLFDVEITIAEGLVAGKVVYMGILRDVTDSLSVEEESRLQEEKMKAVMNAVADGIVTIDEMGQIYSVNKTAVDMFGFKSQEPLVGNNVKMLMPEPYRSGHDGYLESYRKTGIQKVIGVKGGREVAALRQSGESFPVRITVTEVAVGSARLFTGVLHDVSAQRKKQEQLKKSEDRIRGLIEANSDAIVTIDDAGMIENANPAALSMFQWSREEIMGQNVKMLAPEPYRSEHDEYLRSYRDTGIRKIIGLRRGTEVAAQRKDGETFPIEIAVSESIVGSRRFFTAIIRDITERNLKEMSLKRGEERVRSFFETATDGMVSIDEYGTIKAMNRSCAGMFGYDDSEDAVGQNVKILMPSPYREEHDEYVRNYATTGNAILMGKGPTEVTGIHTSGHVFPLQLTLSESVVGSQTIYTGILRDITERKANDEMLRAAEEKVRSILDTACDGIVVIETDGRIETFNTAAEQMWGYSSTEVIGKNVKMLMPEPYSGEHDEYLMRYMTTGEKKVIGSTRQLSGLKKDGRVFPVTLGVSEVQAGSRRVFTGIVRDISLKMQADEEMAKKESRLMGIIDSASDAVIVMTVSCEILSFNRAAEKMFQVESEQVLGADVKTLMPSPYAEQHTDFVNHYLRTGIRKVIGFTREAVAMRRDGGVFPMEISVSEAIVGSTRQFTAIIRDITERKQSEEKLRKSEERMKMMMENAIDGVITIDDDGVILSINPAVVKIWGFSKDEMINQNVRVLMPEPYRLHHDSYIKKYMQTGQKKILGKLGNEVLGRRKDGSVFDLSLSVSESTIGSSKVFTGIVRDITHQKRDERALNESEDKVQRLFEGAMMGIILIDSTGIVTDCNQYICDVFEYKKEDLVGQNVKVLMPHDIAVEHDMYMRRYRYNGQRRIIGSVRKVDGMTSSGVVVHVELAVSEPVPGVEFCGMIRDVTERVSSELKSGLDSLIATRPMTAFGGIDGSTLMLSQGGFRASDMIVSRAGMGAQPAPVVELAEGTEDDRVEIFDRDESRGSSIGGLPVSYPGTRVHTARKPQVQVSGEETYTSRRLPSADPSGEDNSRRKSLFTVSAPSRERLNTTSSIRDSISKPQMEARARTNPMKMYNGYSADNSRGQPNQPRAVTSFGEEFANISVGTALPRVTTYRSTRSSRSTPSE